MTDSDLITQIEYCALCKDSAHVKELLKLVKKLQKENCDHVFKALDHPQKEGHLILRCFKCTKVYQNVEYLEVKNEICN